MSHIGKSTDKKGEWQNIVKTYKAKNATISELFTDDELRIRILFFNVYLLFGFISIGMTVLNFYTGWRALMVSTLVFGLVNILNVVLCFVSKTAEFATRILFAVESCLLFLFFAIVGEPEGFSIIWAAVLPTCGMLLYRLKYGTILAGTQQIILFLLFWTPFGKNLLMYDYTETFLFRFPILYMAFFAAGILFEFVRSNTQSELLKTRDEYAYLSNHDTLTGLFNRYGFNLHIDELMKQKNKSGYSFAIMDIDHFKNVNDTYGHGNGDIVLKKVASEIRDAVGDDGIVCRWGGEEFSILFDGTKNSSEICNNIINGRRMNDFVFDGKVCHVTISIGLLKVGAGKKLSPSEIITKSDANLYKSKTCGRDRLTESCIQ